MLISLLAAGSRGDVQPYLALGVELTRLGFRARLATHNNFRDLVERAGLEFYPIRGDVAQAALSADARLAHQADNPLKLLLSFRRLAELAAGLQVDFYEACQGAEAVVYHPGAAVGYFAARQMGVPSILAAPFPMAPTPDYPALIFYNGPRLGGWFNLGTHRLFERIMWMASAEGLGDFWRRRFGELPAEFGAPYARQNTPSAPTVVSCSPQVFAAPAGGGQNIHHTGFWFYEEAAGWTPPPALLEFLEGGALPVYVGFGSMGLPDEAGQTTRLVIEALRRVGRRGVLAAGWNGLSRLEALPADIYMLDSAPHGWLFPRLAAVVHHGGAGTTAAGLRAGVPAVIVPHSNDQFAWARRAYELGVAARPLPRKQLDAERLAGRIQAALAASARAAAQALGQRLAVEAGAAAAARIIGEAAGG